MNDDSCSIRIIEQLKEIKVTVLLEHYEREEYWSASVPLINGCLADGRTPEEAIGAITSEIGNWIEINPGLLDVLKGQPEFMIAEVPLVLRRGGAKANA